MSGLSRGGFSNVLQLHDKPASISHLQTGQFYWMNEPAMELFGLPPGALVENYRSTDFYVFPSHRKRILDHLEESNLSDPVSVAVKSLDEKLYVLKLRARLIRGIFPSIFSVAEEVKEVG